MDGFRSQCLRDTRRTRGGIRDEERGAPKGVGQTDLALHGGEEQRISVSRHDRAQDDRARHFVGQNYEGTTPNIDRKKKKEVALWRNYEKGGVQSFKHSRDQGKTSGMADRRKKKKKKRPTEKQPVKIILGSGERSPKKVPERRSENAERQGDKKPLPRTA
jgi:hypothetical protein